jgi:hypothetical protein
MTDYNKDYEQALKYAQQPIKGLPIDPSRYVPKATQEEEFIKHEGFPVEMRGEDDDFFLRRGVNPIHPLAKDAVANREKVSPNKVYPTGVGVSKPTQGMKPPPLPVPAKSTVVDKSPSEEFGISDVVAHAVYPFALAGHLYRKLNSDVAKKLRKMFQDFN